MPPLPPSANYPPSPTHSRLLVAAIWAFVGGDAPVGFARFDDDVSADGGTSVVAELTETLAAQGPATRPSLPDLLALLAPKTPLDPAARAALARVAAALRAAPAGGCCDAPPAPELPPPTDPAALAAVRFEDQDGRLLGFGDLTAGRPTVVAFFYTRCGNPRKCSLTVAKLARVQQLLAADPTGTPVGLVAITYDPAFDTPARLQAYAIARGLRLEERCRVVRAVEGIDAVRNHFQLRVGYAGPLVNRHRLELFVCDAAGVVVAGFTRAQSEPAEVAGAARDATRWPERVRRWAAAAVGVGATVGLALVPKCPDCWAAYASVFGVVGPNHLPYPDWQRPALTAAVAINVVCTVRRAAITRRVVPLALVVAGTVVVALSQQLVIPRWVLAAGTLAVVIGSAVSAVTHRRDRENSRLQLLLRSDLCVLQGEHGPGPWRPNLPRSGKPKNL